MDRADACALAAYAEALARIAKSVEHYGPMRDDFGRDDTAKMREYVDAIVKLVAPSRCGLPEMEGERDAWKQNAEEWARERDDLRRQIAQRDNA